MKKLILVLFLSGCIGIGQSPRNNEVPRKGSSAVFTDTHFGSSWRCYISVGHVVDAPGEKVVNGEVCDVYRLTDGPDPVVLLIPRCKTPRLKEDELIPGVSGAPVTDETGRVVSLIVGKYHLTGELAVVDLDLRRMDD